MTDTESNAGEAYVSTAPETSVLSKGSDGGSSKKGKTPDKDSGARRKKKASKGHPWRDNIEAVAISIVTIVLFKYFVLEAYKIPTGSMQPTLMGNAETGIFDRVIVDKLSYHFRDPERFEIAVFKYPLDSSKNFIKRIIGMPGERLFLQNGDPWVQKDGEDQAKVLRRSRRIQNVQLRRLETKKEWRAEGGARDWKTTFKDSGDLFEGRGSGKLSFPRTYESVRDDYLDGYPAGMKKKVNDQGKGSNFNDVTDLRARFNAKVDAGCMSVTCTLHEGRREFRFELPGPASPNLTGKIEVRNLGAVGGTWETEKVLASEVRLEAGDSIDIEVQNLNDLLALRIDGDEVATLEIPPMEGRGSSRVSLDVQAKDDALTKLSKVRVWRDIYYTADPTRQKITEWEIPEGNYVVLGDNSQDSSDGRDWTFVRFRELGEDGRILRGNQRESAKDQADSNPRFSPARHNAETIYMYDELGERHVLDADQVKRLPDDTKSASLVPRELIRGRAVLVVWPLAPQHDVYRWKWVR